METFDQIRTLMTELGPLLELEEVTEFPEERSFGLLIDEETPVTADYDDEHHRILLSADVAALPETDRLPVYEMLLQYNLQWFETGGLRMALDGPGGHVVQMVEIPATHLEVAALGAALSRFVESLKAWRLVLSESVGEAAPSSTPTESSGDDGMIRV